MRLTRRRVLAVALCASLMMAAAACGSSSTGSSSSSSGAASGDSSSSCAPVAAGEKVTLTYASWVPGMDEVIALWNKENPDIQVDFKSVPSGPSGTYQNYSNQLKAGTAGDLGFIEYASLPSFLVQDGLMDISSCPGVKDAAGTFVDSAWAQVQVGNPDAVYAIPQDIGPMGLYYRKDLFDANGIAVPTTYDEYLAAAQKIKAATGQHITNLSGASAAFWAGEVWQYGDPWFGLDGNAWTVNIDGDGSKAVADYWQKLVDGGMVTNLPSFQDAFYQSFNTSDTWSIMAGPWFGKLLSTKVPDQAGKWAVAQIPQWKAGDTASANWGGGTMAVFKGSAHPAEATKFALWLNTNPEALALNVKNGGQYPAIKNPEAVVPALAQGDPYFGGQDIWTEFSTSAANVSGDWVWGPTMTQVYADLGDALNGPLSGQGQIADAFASTQTKTVDALKAQAIDVAGS